MSALSTQAHSPKGVPIRPAATLLLIRDGETGLEVMTMRRSASMRFLPGYLAFPGGAVDDEDFDYFRNIGADINVTGQEHSDDPVYAVAALRECAEEIGWACALRTADGVAPDTMVPAMTQQQLLRSELTYHAWLAKNGNMVDFSKLRFIGRWVTPRHMPARFDTRFFAYAVNTSISNRLGEPTVSLDENDWARWLNPTWILEKIRVGEFDAVPPTIAMLEGLSRCQTSSECLSTMRVPGPPAEA